MADQYKTREERRKQLSAQKGKKSKGKKNPRGIFKKIFLALIALGIIGMLTGVATFAFMVKDTPKLDESRLRDPISSKLYDINGEEFAEVGSVNRDYVAYEDIPKLVENAILATEDVRFYDHNGIDIIRLGGAVIANITDGFGSEGASTITQQVVKNSFLEFDKTLSRKAQEAWLAFQLERKYTKQEIFEMYVNKIYMSQKSHGILTASRVYFDKELAELELHEAALLAGMPQSPENYNPFKYPENAEKRRNIVLSLMNQHGFITKEEMKAAQAIPVESSLVKGEDRETDDEPYDAFVDAVIEEVQQQGDFDIFSDGLKIYTTLDQDAQTYVESMLNSNEVVQFPDDQFQAGITLLDTKTGEVRALGGGRNQQAKRGFNYAVDTKRQPGSTIKPILDYGPAIEYLQWGTYHTLDDKPYTYSDPKKTPINNWDNKHMGPMSMREALARSRNVPALQALQAVGLNKAKDFAVKLGIPLEEVYESYAIGGLDKGVSPLEMAGAYSAFGNNGFYTKPHTVKMIELRDGTKLDTAPEPQVVMKDYTAFMITDMLKSVLKESYGTGQAANVPSLPVAGKTGTTNYSSDVKKANGIPDGAVPDSWFAGYTTNYTAAIWTGYENQKKNYIKSKDQKIAQQLFKNLMAHVSKGKETADFTVPKSVEKVAIEKGTIPAKLASEFTPEDQIIYEYAVKGHGPSQVSDRYDRLDSPTNANASYEQATNEIVLSWDYNGKADGVQFEVSASINGGPAQQLAVTGENGLRVANVVAGGNYTFTITAVKGDQRSEPASVSASVPAPANEEDEFEEGEDEGRNREDDENEQEEDDDGGESNGGEGGGQGVNPGTGSGNGNGNGNSGGNGNAGNPGTQPPGQTTPTPPGTPPSP
ncbi:penicillin-binding protein [Bacillus sp. V3-13]|uniref:PBP1A family penicillin-binding protein n=1 Tax=Bacillus sp. V3-13 TaxID=2053728 RepID=UPI000C778B3B|nr:PBP1A family penicillin-binding protein [Bacillus sp. V3-13]PLR77175.1 penicillin-binding protein [Bacillus sp. V3-13]